MHTRAAPKEELFPDYEGRVVADVLTFLAERREVAQQHGVSDEQIVLDPGPDFAKTPQETVQLLQQQARLHQLGRPVLLALSNKYFLGAITARPPAQRLAATLAAVAECVGGGGQILRVHDVRAVADFLAVRAVLRGDAPMPSFDPDDNRLKWIR
jgi:dihydropteroate synthase